jgi:hypothetical protein
MTLQTILTWWLFITLALCGVYDVWAVLWGGPNSTVSFELYRLGRRMPAMYLAVGFLIGHLIMPLHIHDGNDR